MENQVKIGDKIDVTVKLEFDGTVRNHAILIENQFIPTINNERKNFQITLDGDPIQIEGKFIGVRGSSIKKFEISINKKAAFKVENIKFKYESIELKMSVPYSKFNLTQI